ncbi:ACR269Cp [Eremothecium gossypii ATCC 10895]|uniref:ACR269Cp n=1 Tax=Eremothecium gossypii (strain ATCC 10895 / CBS 109.51 / FGSC 9923 / NRRL Y-1056) TaxID=284811 RepID=Q75BK2_EREGS|nr:ACR269Cp [Eremothecium gossypii ATCC 10895]AAS51495.1 ACR269Cp [Eremothecium gossypii ATCC 10895]
MHSVRVGYIPEHFSAPLLFAQTLGFFAQRGVTAKLVPFPSGSGHLIQALDAGELDLALGLTEAFVRGIADTPAGAAPRYQIAGTYVRSPLNWAVSVGAASPLEHVDQLDGGRVGVSRVGSGSYVMSYVLALQRGFRRPFAAHPVCHTFAGLRAAVNDGAADAFLWEHFTSKRYHDAGEIRLLGNIPTPWPSWVLVKHTALEPAALAAFAAALDDGIAHFEAHPEAAVALITQHFDYSAEDAAAWRTTVRFHRPCCTLHDRTAVVDATLAVLQAAGVLRHAADPELVQRNVERGLYAAPAGEI